MEASIACAKAGVTTGEWAGVLREVFGEFRAPTGVSAAVAGGEARHGDRGRARAGAGHRRRAGHAPAHAGRQARPRRALQRRRAGRRARPRRRLRGRLPGHPAHARRRSSRPRSRRTCTSSGCRCCPARTWRWCPPSSTACARPAPVDVPVIVGGIIPPEDAAVLREQRRRGGVHAEGLPAHRDDGRDRHRWSGGPTRSALLVGYSGQMCAHCVNRYRTGSLRGHPRRYRPVTVADFGCPK